MAPTNSNSIQHHQQPLQKINACMVEHPGGKEPLNRSRSSSTTRYCSNVSSSGSSQQSSLPLDMVDLASEPPSFLTKPRHPLIISGNSSKAGTLRSRIPWRWSRVRAGITRRKKEPMVDELMGGWKTDRGLSHAHERPAGAAMLRDSIEDSNPFASSDAADSSREEITRGKLVTGRSSFEQTSLHSAHNHRHAAHRMQLHHRQHCNRSSGGRGLSHVYQPKIFEDIVGQEMIVKALRNAIQMRRISPLYLFHGPGGTGKTSTAQVFSMALSCDSASPPKPCWGCPCCSRSMHTAELCYGTRNSGFKKIRTMLESTMFMQSFSGLKVFVLDECNSLSAYSWTELLDMEEKDHGSLVLIMITEDMSIVPRAVSSRCQKFSFQKLKETDVTLKLAKIVAQEGIEIRMDALQLIAKKVEGNLREAENLLDQLALLGQTITPTVVQELVGLIPQDKLIYLLDATLSGDSIEALRHTRDLIACGFEAHSIVSQLAWFVTEILTATASSPMTTLQDNRSTHCQLLPNCNAPGKTKSEKLCQILEILIDTEKQITSSRNPTTSVTAAMLQITSNNRCNRLSTGITMPENRSPTASRINSTAEFNEAGTSDDQIHNSEVGHHQSSKPIPQQQSNSAHDLNTSIKTINIKEVWCNMLERIKDKSIREFLCSQAKLVSLTVSTANAIVHLIFKHSKDKPTAEMSEEPISVALKAALGCPVIVNISHEPTQIEIKPTNCAIYYEKQAAEPSHSGQQKAAVLVVPKPSGSFECREIVLNRSASQTASTNMEGALTSGKMQKTMQTSVCRGDHKMSAHGDSLTRSQQTRLSGHLARYSIDGSLTNNKNYSGRDQPFDTAFIAKATELKQRLLSISSIPQTDASIEPYSQDLLFEEANSERHQAARDSKPCRDSLKPKEYSRGSGYKYVMGTQSFLELH